MASDGRSYDESATVSLPRFCGMVKVSDILFPKEGKDRGKSAKGLYSGV